MFQAIVTRFHSPLTFSSPRPGPFPTNPAADPLQHGFDVNIGGREFGSPTQGDGYSYFAGPDGKWAGFPGLEPAVPYPQFKYLSDALTEKAIEYMGQQTTNPFFVSMWHYSVQTPIQTTQVPSNLLTKYTKKINNLQAQG